MDVPSIRIKLLWIWGISKVPTKVLLRLVSKNVIDMT